MITVAILTRNRLAKLQQCITSVLCQLGPGEDILVLDTGSSDGTRPWLEAQPLPLRHVFVDAEQVDFAAARNAVAQQSSAQAIVFLDDDCVAPADWLPKIRANLSHADITAGLVLPGYQYHYPWWWNAELLWTVGMSGPGVLFGREDSYPAAANLAIRRQQLLEHPFEVTAHGFNRGQVYYGGREDAQWWLKARRRGARLLLDPTLEVFHRIPAQRIRLAYILERAHIDGLVNWRRDPSDKAHQMAALKDFFRSLFEPLLSPIQSLKDPSQTVANLVWGVRQLGYGLEASRSRQEGTAASSLARAAAGSAKQAVKHKLGPAVLRVQKRLQRPFDPPKTPRQVLVLAPTFLGDCIMIQPVLRLFAQNWPTTTIVVLTTYPEIFDLPETLVQVMPLEAMHSRELKNYAYAASEVNFTPYYPMGDPKLWRSLFAARAVTFDSEVGLPRRRDYFLAPVVLPKDRTNHEIYNLLRLMSFWPLAGALPAPRLSPSSEALEQLFKRFPALKEGAYFTVQLGCGNSIKDWPEERWALLAKTLFERTAMRPVFFGAPEYESVARRLIQEFGLKDALSVGAMTTTELTALLSQASLAMGACSGPKHMAYALRTPTFTVYGPTEPERWGALFDRELHGLVRSPVCYLSQREHAGLVANHAMRLVSVEMATQALFEHLERLQELK